MKLYEKILSRRTDRLDEWSMDELAAGAIRLELALKACEDLIDHATTAAFYLDRVNKISAMGFRELMIEAEKE